ncbi:MAG TPA: hypothetical protein VJH34_00045 [archaeon]|nr:hypothetical protein [archaeon]
MAEEKIVTLNLRKKMLKVGGWRRKKVIVGKIKDYVAKIFDVEEIILEKKLSEKAFLNPLAKFKLKINKLDDKTVRVELIQ